MSSHDIPEQRTPAEFLADALNAQGDAHFPNGREAETMATRIRRTFEGCGWTVEGLPDDLTPEQGVEFLEAFLVKLQAVTA